MKPRRLLRAIIVAAALPCAAQDEKATSAAEKPPEPTMGVLLSEGIETVKQRAAALLNRPTEPASPPAIARASDVLSLGIAEARARPRTVRVQGVVTFVVPDRNWVYIQDSSAGILIVLAPGIAAGQPIEVGQQVTADGKTDGGSMAPFVYAVNLAASGKAPLPRASVVTPIEVLAQRPFGQWVETEGLVREAYAGKDGRTRIQIVRENGAFEAVLYGDGKPFLQRSMLGARLSVRGLCWSFNNGHLQVPPGNHVSVISSSEAWGFERVSVDAASLKGSTGDAFSVVRGTLQMVDLFGRWRVLADDGTPFQANPAFPFEGGISGETVPSPAPGDSVLVEGLFIEMGGYLMVRQAWLRDLGRGRPLPNPIVTTTAGADSAERTGRLLTVRGRLISIEDKRGKRAVAPYDSPAYVAATIESEDDNTRIHAIIPPEFQKQLRALPADRLVQITGYQIPASLGANATPQLWPRTVSDITSAGLTRDALRRYTWWGAGGLAGVLLTGGGFLWALREKLKRQRTEAAMLKTSEAKIREINASLEHRVAERTAELAAANERLKRASDEALASLGRERELGDLKSNFVSMVSHEFRTPLAVILSSTELLSNHLDRLPPERRARQLESIRGSTQQMARLIEEVLLLGKVEAGRMTFAPQPLDLRKFCAALVDEAHSASARRCPITLDCAMDLPMTIHADAALLRHVFTNLLSNASKYSPAGSPIHFGARKENGEIVFHVEDQGIGIPEVDLPQIFEPFQRARNVGNISGTGLGLMIAKRCVDLHGGSIEINSPPGEGTTLTVRLPVCEDPKS